MASVQERTAAQWSALGVVCPRCGGTLDAGGPARLVCAACREVWDVVCGIPDLRTGDDPYLTKAEDRAAAERLAARGESLAFGALYASYYEGNAKVPPAQAAQFTRGVLAAGARATSTLDVWRDMASGWSPHPDALTLDLGAGTAPLGVELARRGAKVLAMDAGLRWLVMARRRAAEAGVDLPVVCANAEQLPLRDGAVATIVGESVLENLADPERGLREAFRVSSADGKLCLTTANRWSVGPDPHLGILAGGWRSEMSLRAYAARTGQVFPRRRLYSAGGIERALAGAGFRQVQITLPRFAAAQLAGLPLPLRAAVAGYHLARELPVIRAAVTVIGPTLVITASRP